MVRAPAAVVNRAPPIGKRPRGGALPVEYVACEFDAYQDVYVSRVYDASAFSSAGLRSGKGVPWYAEVSVAGEVQ